MTRSYSSATPWQTLVPDLTATISDIDNPHVIADNPANSLTDFPVLPVPNNTGGDLFIRASLYSDVAAALADITGFEDVRVFGCSKNVNPGDSKLEFPDSQDWEPLYDRNNQSSLLTIPSAADQAIVSDRGPRVSDADRRYVVHTGYVVLDVAGVVAVRALPQAAWAASVSGSSSISLELEAKFVTQK